MNRVKIALFTPQTNIFHTYYVMTAQQLYHILLPRQNKTDNTQISQQSLDKTRNILDCDQSNYSSRIFYRIPPTLLCNS